jgi:hypothetical protein
MYFALWVVWEVLLTAIKCSLIEGQIKLLKQLNNALQSSARAIKCSLIEGQIKFFK